MPTPCHAPQAIDTAGRPAARRSCARPSRNPFAAAYPEVPVRPNQAVLEENNHEVFQIELAGQ